MPTGAVSIALILLAANLSAASFCETALPQSPKASALTLGTGNEFFTWTLIVSHASGPVSWGDIAERLPFSILPAWQAEDVLNRKSAEDKRTVMAVYFSGVKDLGPSGLMYGAARASNPYVKGVLLGVGGLWALAQARSVAKAPNPSKTVAHVLPDAGVAGDWSGVVVTGLRHDAQKIGPLCDDPAIVLPSQPIIHDVPAIWDGHRDSFGTTLPVFDKTVYECSADTPALRAWRLERIMQARRVMAGL